MSASLLKLQASSCKLQAAERSTLTAPQRGYRLPPTAYCLILTSLGTPAIAAISSLGQNVIIMYIIGKNLAPQSLHSYPGEHKPHQKTYCREK